MGIQDRDYYWERHGKKESGKFKKIDGQWVKEGSTQGPSSRVEDVLGSSKLSELDRKGTYYRPKEFRSKRRVDAGKPIDWDIVEKAKKRDERARFRQKVYARPERRGLIKGLMLGAAGGGFVTFWVMLAILHLDAEVVGGPYRALGSAMRALGLL